MASPLFVFLISYKKSIVKSKAIVYLFSACLILGLLSLKKNEMEISSWRQYSPIHQNLLNIYHYIKYEFYKNNLKKESKSIVDQKRTPKLIKEETVNKILSPDLNGKPFVRLNNKNTNVLLIILEGVSGSYLKSYVDLTNISKNYQMNLFNKWSYKGLSFKNFISLQRQTNRGEYALLCGRFPNLVNKNSKMDYYAEQENIDISCLSQYLKKAGYKTVYLQAAPTSFMSKDRFMKNAGFDEIHGKEWFKTANAWSSWGLDDLAFFEQSVKMVDKLQNQEKSWFLTLLTVGTHHPYTVDTSWTREKSGDDFAKAIAYLDFSLDKFLKEIKKKGIFENTLIIITSDESNGLKKANNIKRILSENWIPLVILTPNKEKKLVSDYYIQSDLPLSVLDYLGIKINSSNFIGRSFFRNYSYTRPLFFANTYRNIIGMIYPPETMLLCNTTLRDCDSFQKLEKDIITGSITRITLQEDMKNILEKVLLVNEIDADNTIPFKDYNLTKSGKVVINNNNKNIFFGYQYLKLPPQSGIQVYVEAEVLKGEINLYMDMGANKGEKTYFRTRKVLVKKGQKFSAKLMYILNEEDHAFECRFYGINNKKEEVILSIKKAKMRISYTPRQIKGLILKKVTLE